MVETADPASTINRSRLTASTAAFVVAAFVLASCGRSAPEGAVAVDPGGAEPAAAGVQVASEQPVIVPPPTTATIPTTVTTVPAQPAGTYVVQAGDTLSVIAEQFGISIQALSDANGITDVNSIQPGQELIIPAAG